MSHGPAEPRLGVAYPHLEQFPLIERVAFQEVTVALGRGVQGLLQDCYGAQFATDDLLPHPDVIQQIYNSSEANGRSQAGRMRKHMQKKGAEYWIVRNPDQPDPGIVSLIGLAKAKPVRPGLSLQRKDVYFNDILVHPADQRQGFGLALAHAALRFRHSPDNVWDIDAKLSLGGYEHSTVNAWFENGWGLTRGRLSRNSFPIGARHLSQYTYATVPGERPHASRNVADVLARFETRQPHLKNGSMRTR